MRDEDQTHALPGRRSEATRIDADGETCLKETGDEPEFDGNDIRVSGV